VSDAPVLVINGTADPRDPPANMAGAQQIWPNSREVTEPWQSHGVDINAWTQCDATLVQIFVETASIKRLDTGCLAQARLPPFAVSR
jgi:pimeloyl-ACP methyl ester carboxylesterase